MREKKGVCEKEGGGRQEGKERDRDGGRARVRHCRRERESGRRGEKRCGRGWRESEPE